MLVNLTLSTVFVVQISKTWSLKITIRTLPFLDYSFRQRARWCPELIQHFCILQLTLHTHLYKQLNSNFNIFYDVKWISYVKCSNEILSLYVGFRWWMDTHRAQRLWACCLLVSDTITLPVESWPVRHWSSVAGKCAVGHCTGAILSSGCPV